MSVVDEIPSGVMCESEELSRFQFGDWGGEALHRPYCRYPLPSSTVASQHVRLTSKGRAATALLEDSVTVLISSREVAIKADNTMIL